MEPTNNQLARVQFDKTNADKAAFRRLPGGPLTFAESSDGKTSVTGYAVVWDCISVEGRVIPKGSGKAPGYPVVMLYNHEDNWVLASEQNGSLTLTADDHGIAISATLDATFLDDYVAGKIASGVIQGMSFGCYPLQMHTEQRTITDADIAGNPELAPMLGKTMSVEVYDQWVMDEVSVCPRPQFPQTEIALASRGEKEPAAEQQNTENVIATAGRVSGDAETKTERTEMSDTQTPVTPEQPKADKPEIRVIDNAAIKEQVVATFKQEKTTMETQPNALEGIRHFARTGKMEFGITSATDTAIYMPVAVPGLSIVRQSSNAIRRGFALCNAPTFVTETTENMNLPFVDDSANTAQTNQEGATSGTSADPSAAGSLNLVQYNSRALWFSNKVVKAQSFDITGYALPVLTSRNERKEDTDWAATIIADTGAVAVTTASATAITYGEWAEFDGALDPKHDGVPQFYILSASAKAALRGLVDGSGKPILNLEQGMQTLFGKPVVVSAAMETVAANHVVAALISVENTVIRDVAQQQLLRYENESGHPAQVGFELISWSAFAYSGSVKTLKTKAS